MTDHSDKDLQHVLECSAAFYGELNEILGDRHEIGSQRDLLTQGTVKTVFEHGISIVLLVQGEQLASASVLLRAQFEALVRALWLHHVVDDAWADKYIAKLQADSRKDPGYSRTMDEMLKDLAAKAPPAIARKLLPLKEAAWGPLNSYVHSGIHPIVHQHAGVSSEFALATLWNANGLTGMAATLTAILSEDVQQVNRVIDAQYAHLDCLPPVNPTPAPSPTRGGMTRGTLSFRNCKRHLPPIPCAARRFVPGHGMWPTHWSFAPRPPLNAVASS